MRFHVGVTHGGIWAALVVLAGCSSREMGASEGAATQHLEGDGGGPTDGGSTVDPVEQIDAKWVKLGGAAVVGDATSEIALTPGRLAYYREYVNGVIVHSRTFGAVYLSHAVFDKWISLQNDVNGDGQNLHLYVGLPRADFKEIAGDIDASFQRGRIIGRLGALHVVHGEIHAKYETLRSSLGMPEAEQASGPNGGRYQVFAHGEIHWRAGIGAFGIIGTIRDRWNAVGGAGGPLGYPTSDSSSIPGTGGQSLGLSNRFERGAIFWSERTGAWDMSGDILSAYENRFGGATGWLGFPAGAPGKNAPGDPFQDFERGVLVRHIAPGRPFDGVQAFGELSFLFDRLQGHGSDCTFGVCGDLEIQADLSIDRSVGDSIRVHYDEFENEKTFNDRRLVFDRAKSTFRATAKIEAWEYDDGPRDHMGTTSQEYSIDNLWGLEISPKHSASGEGDLSVDNYFVMENKVPFNANDFRGQLFWGFKNQGTGELTYNQFAATFADVDPDEAWWRHPFNHLFYQFAYKGVAEGGNCFGLTTESVYSQTGRSLFNQPINRWPWTDGLINEVNIKQGYQLGYPMASYMLQQIMRGFTHRPKDGYTFGEQMFNAGTHTMVSMYKGSIFGEGHSVRPFRYARETCRSGTGDCWHIYIADSNYPKPPNMTDEYIEINPSNNTFEYKDYKGGENVDDGGALSVQPFSLVSSIPDTALSEVQTLIFEGFQFMVGGPGQVDQISDSEGRKLFKPGREGQPKRWSDMVRDPAARIPNVAPMPVTDGNAPPAELYFGQGASGTQIYEVTLKAGVAAGTPYEATFSSGRIASSVSVPGTPGKSERITAHDLAAANAGVRIAIPQDGEAKRIKWTVSSAEKQRWAEFADLAMAPSQDIDIELDNAGYQLNIVNNGPATSARVTVKAGPGATPVVVGQVEIPPGTSAIEYERPVTTSSLSNEVQGLAGWLIAPVTVTLTAQDFSSKGIKRIEYSRDRVNWLMYASPFIYADEGTTMLHYRATDNALNVERIKSRELKIDTRVPVVTLSTDKPAYTRVEPALVNFAATDPLPGSGVSQVTAKVDNDPVTNGQKVDLFWFPLGAHTLAVDAKDVAGWESNKWSRFEVIATVYSLEATIKELERRGEISTALALALCIQARDAALQVELGLKLTAIVQLEALILEIRLQCKNLLVTERAAALLEGDIRYVIDRLKE